MNRFTTKLGLSLNVFITLVFLALFSCQNDSRKEFIIDLEKATDVTNSKKSLSSIIESYRVIRLETSTDCLIGKINKVVKKNSLFFIQTSGTDLFVFDNEGNYIRKIGNMGKGPGEYLKISDFALNADGSIIAICSYKEILFFRVEDGSFLKKQSLDYFVSSICYLPNEELLVQVTQTDFLIAHIDTDGKIINSFGSMSRALELDQKFEFVKLDDSNFMYRIGETSDYYLYNFRKKLVTKNEIFRSKNALDEQELHEELEAAGPDGYRMIGDFLRNHYSIKYVKMLGSNILVSYLFKEKSRIILYNPKTQIKRDIVFRPEESSNLVDDVLLLSSEVFIYMNRANSDDNSILIYLYPQVIKKYVKDKNSNSLIQSGNYESVLGLYNSLKTEDNPLIVEYVIKEI